MIDSLRIICLMTSSIDGRLHPSRYTESPDGTSKDWSAAYAAIHDATHPDGWIVGRTTMAEMAKGDPHPPADPGTPARPHHFARTEGPFAVALDRSGKLHFTGPEIDGDHVVVLLGPDVPDTHLAELAADGVSYVVAEDVAMALTPLLKTLAQELGVEALMLEGGGHVNGSFFAAGLVDELHVVIAPALDGAPSTAIVEAGEDGLKGKVRLSLAGCERLEGGAVHLRYTVTAG
jgi:riboflavin biosynthesis pyrimidine reductase